MADSGASLLSQALKRCASGDRSALRDIYESEADAMLGVAMRIVRRREVAEDVVHEAFIKIWRNAQRYDPALGSPRSWLFAIVRNQALNTLRDGRREELVDEIPEPAIDQAASDPFGIVDRMPESNALKRCLEGLDPRRRASLVMAYVDGFSHGEIAGRLSLPLGTVKAWIRRSLLSLKECMG